MPTNDVPRENWTELFRRVTHERHGQPVTLEVRRPAPAEIAGDFAIERAPVGEILTRGAPLMEVVFDEDDSGAQVVVAVSGADAHRFVVPEPARVRFEERDGRAAVVIESTNQRLTLLRIE